MAFSKKRLQNTVPEIIQIPVEKLIPNTEQPRTSFDSQALRELALSIEQHGILQPLSVRRAGFKYELIAGERRLRAAKLAGLSSVPCMVLQADDMESSLLSLIENVQRRDLDFFETAQGYQRLMLNFGLTQEQVALRIGKTQSAVANKLRLLRFDADLISFIRAAGLTERHCRAVLRLPASHHRWALEQIAAQTLTVAQTEELVDSLISSEKTASASVCINEYFSSFPNETSSQKMYPAAGSIPSGSDFSESASSSSDTSVSNASKSEKRGIKHKDSSYSRKSGKIGGKLLVKDARIFLNTILRAFDVMKASGIDAFCQQREEADYTELLIRIPRRHVENGIKIPIEQS